MTTDESPLAGMVNKLRAHALLSPGDVQALLDLPYTVRYLGAGRFLVRDGDEAEECAVLVAGCAYRQKVTAGGERQILSINLPGDMLDLQHLFLTVADHSIQTLTAATVAVVASKDIRDLMLARPAINHAILVNMAVEGAIAREWMLNLGRRDSRAKVAHLLCEFAIRFAAEGANEGQDYVMPMTQDQLADTLGLTPVHVNRMLRALENQGAIRRVGRRISFPAWAQLRHTAGFDAAYLHAGQQIA